MAAFLAACQSDICNVKGTIAKSDSVTLLISPCVTDSSLLVNATGHHTDTVAVVNGSFQWQTEADTAQLYHIWTPDEPQRDISFFTERGTVSVSFDSTSIRVSGTYLNDQWQALNDSIADYVQRIDRIVRTLTAAGTSPSIVSQRVSLVYEEMEKLIASTAERNKDNELGRFIRYQHPFSSFSWH